MTNAAATSKFLRVDAHGMKWIVAPDFAPRLVRVLDSPASVIKESRPKLVSRHDAEGRAWFVKTYRHHAVALRPLKYWFKLSPAREEWRIADELERRSIPIVRHVALGERWSARGLLESCLVTEAFRGVPVNEAPDLRPDLLSSFVRQLARAGVWHRDFHPANILTNPSGSEIRLVDLDGITLNDTMPADVIEKDMLAQLCINMPLPVAPDVAELALAKRRGALAARSRRCLKNNRDFAVQNHGGRKWHVRLDAATPAFCEVLAAPDEFLGSGRMLKNGRSSTVAADRGLVIKRYNFRRWLRPIKDLFRHSRARQAFQKAYHLELCGIPTARPLAVADERRCGFIIRSFLVAAEIKEARDIASFSGNSVAAARRIGTLVGRMHREGFAHRDLKESNILIDAAGMPWLVDLDGLVFRGIVPSAESRSNLERLARGASAARTLPPQVLFAFLRGYCRARKLRVRALFPVKR